MKGNTVKVYMRIYLKTYVSNTSNFSNCISYFYERINSLITGKIYGKPGLSTDVEKKKNKADVRRMV